MPSTALSRDGGPLGGAARAEGAFHTGADRVLVEPAPAVPRLHTLPTRYDGPDLADVAAMLRLPTAEVVRRHQAAIWTVAAIGFSPGFGYLTTPDPLFAEVGRRADPRPKVPRGSVALAAQMCAVYPSATPGGWQLIGSTTRRAVRRRRRAPRPAAGRRPRRVRRGALMAGLRVVGLSGAALFQDAGRQSHRQRGAGLGSLRPGRTCRCDGTGGRVHRAGHPRGRRDDRGGAGPAHHLRGDWASDA